MAATLIEAVGLLLLLVAAGLTTGAAYLVALPLALLVGGVWALFLGVVAVLAADIVEKRATGRQR